MPRVTIIPARDENGNPCLSTQGTKIYGADGEEIEGVISIELVAAVNDVWKAKIEVLAIPREIVADAQLKSVIPPPPPPTCYVRDGVNGVLPLILVVMIIGFAVGYRVGTL